MLENCFFLLNENQNIVFYSDNFNSIFNFDKKEILKLNDIFNEDIHLTNDYHIINVTSKNKQIFTLHITKINLNEIYYHCLCNKQTFPEEENLKLKTQLDNKLTLFKNLSIELRKPLTNILGYTESIIEGHTTDQLKYLDIIFSNAKEMHGYIEDLLDLSQIELKEIKLEKEICLLNDLVSRTIKNYQLDINEKQIKIKNNLTDSYYLNIDVKLIKKVLNNIIHNSIKFSKIYGNITIYANLTPTNNLELCIEDNGIGISDDKFKKIYDMTINVDDDKPINGTGLGLSISKHYMKLHESELKISSQLNIGTKVCLIFNKKLIAKKSK